MAKQRKRRSSKKKARQSTWRGILLRWLLAFVILALLIGGFALAYLDRQVVERFEGARWSLPAKVYARPLELYPGQTLTREALRRELERLGYRAAQERLAAGTYQYANNSFAIHQRPARFWDGEQPAQAFRVTIVGERVERLADLNGKRLDLVRMPPPMIGSFYPSHGEDRVLVKLDEVPPLLVDTLLAVEDRAFYEHFGLRPAAILRAALVNLRAGRTVQGGSTLTQQLVKNFFLSNERTISRKLVEVLMALIVEWRYDKNDILEAYLNEVYLGQAGARAIHGFGLASEFYFNRPLAELNPEQMALLVGLVKGPSYYSPRRNPERATDRRNVVLGVMGSQDLLAEERVSLLKSSPLGITSAPRSGRSLYPAFMDLVKEQLRRDYSEADIREAGLKIFTTLDPEVQGRVEQAVTTRLQQLERQRGLPGGSLQAAAVVTTAESAEVLAVVADRDPRYQGFNRALNAKRPIGSLIKPAVYLAALRQPQQFNLLTLLDDSPLALEQRNGEVWRPQNYDREYHGQVPLYQALAHSYNVATVRLGLRLGLGQVSEVMQDLGLEAALPANPAMLLGTLELTPLQVTRLYQTLAANGFRTPQRSIRAVLDARGEPLQRYPLQVQQRIDPAAAYLIQAGMRQVVEEGTARSLKQRLAHTATIRGKTGTTNDLRDSWFVGFDSDFLGVVWVGRDDNQPAGLTGSSGALPIWTDVFAHLPRRHATLPPPSGVNEVWVDPHSGKRLDGPCEGALHLPFIAGTEPPPGGRCASGGGAGIMNFLENLFN